LWSENCGKISWAPKKRRQESWLEVRVADLRFKEKAAQDGGWSYRGSTSVDGIISTRWANGSAWAALIGRSPIGKWTLAFPNTVKLKIMA